MTDTSLVMITVGVRFLKTLLQVSVGVSFLKTLLQVFVGVVTSFRRC